MAIRTPREFLKVSPELLKELPLPEGWTWNDETADKWPGASFWGSGDVYVPRIYVWPGRTADKHLNVTDRRDERRDPEDTVVANMDEAYRIIWHKIALGE